jgi:hypothetical protein
MRTAQEATLAITPKITGLLSILGSSWIVVEVLTQKNKRNNVYNRLMCAMSFFDVMSSFAIFASTWPIPKETEGIIFAIGNQNTCIAQGFLIQAGIIAPYCTCWVTSSDLVLSAAFASSPNFFFPCDYHSSLDNFCLALYYMLVVKYKVPEEVLQHNFEPAAHLFCIGAAFLPAIAGIFLNLYNQANIWCWIASYPQGCKNSLPNNGETTCTRGDNAWMYR